MAKKIHFQDDLYQIARTIDILYEGLKLDLDNEFFSEYYLSQILFLDNTITEIFNFLDENKQLIERKIQVRNLYSIEKKFILFLESINPETGIMESISQGNNKIRQVIESHKDKILKLEETVVRPQDETDSQDLVSHEEMEELLNF